MVVKNFYQPTPPVDWTEKLEEVYARQTRQLEEHHRNLRERDQQMVDKVKAEDPVKTIAAVTKFIGQVKTFDNKRQAQKKKQKTKDKDTVKSVFDQHPEGSKELIEAIRGFDETEDKIWEEGKALASLKRIAKDQNSHELLASLDKLDNRQKLLIKETLASLTSQRLANSGAYKQFLDGTSKEALEARAIYDSKDELGQRELENVWRRKEIEKFGLSDSLTLKIVSGNYYKQTATKKGTSKAVAASNYATELRHQRKTILGITGNDANYLAFPETLTKSILLASDKYTNDPKDMEGGQTAIQKGMAEVFEDVKELAINGYLPPSVEAGLKDFRFQHPAGPNNEASIDLAFMTDEQYNSLGWALDQGKKKMVGVATTDAQLLAAQIPAMALQGVPQEEIDKKVQHLKNTGLLKPSEITRLENINLSAQSEANYKLELKELETASLTGLKGWKQANVDEIKNDKVRAIAQLRFDQLESHKAQNSDKDLEGNFKSKIQGIISSSPYAQASDLKHPLGVQISNELDRDTRGEYAKLIWAQYDDKGNLVAENPNINTTINTLKAGLFEARGGGQKGKDKDGRYAWNDRTNDFTNLRKVNNILVEDKNEHKVNATIENVGRWEGQVMTELEANYKNPDGTYDIEKAISDGVFFNKHDLAGVAIHGDYSDRQFVIAEKLNTTPAKLFEAGVAKLLKDDERLARSLGLDNIKGRKEANQLILEGLEGMYNKVPDKQSLAAFQLRDLKFYMRKGWKNLDPKIRNRVLELRQAELEKDPEVLRIRALQKRKKEIEDQRLKTILEPKSKNIG